jgi:fructokinase
MTEPTVNHSDGTQVLVIGEALVDVVVGDGPPTEHPGGSAANVALGLGRLGVSTALLSHLAQDDRGRRVVAHLRESGVDVLDSSFTAARTSSAVASIEPSGAAHYEFDVSWALPAFLPTGSVRVLHLGALPAFLSPIGQLDELISSVAAGDVSFDPNIRPALIGGQAEALFRFEEVVQRATVVKLSDEDAAWLYPGVSLPQVLGRLLGFGARLAIVTRGAQGAIIATSEHRLEVEAVAVRVVDTIGAGDTFMASTISSIVGEASSTLSDLRALAERASLAAAVTASRAGADLPWSAELAVTPDPPRSRQSLHPSHDP